MSAAAPDDLVALPKGGGALRGIGEGFRPDPQTGTGNFTIPIALPPGRNGLAPQLGLTYSSGSGNGHFGLGWSLSVGEVSRKTSHGVPRYDDTRDTFVLAGADDLVPVDGGAPGTQRYRPRVESQFSRIERVRSATDDFWRVWRRSGTVETYGTPASAGSDPAVRRDPTRPDHVFAWHLSEIADCYGNKIKFQYTRAEASTGTRRWDDLMLSEIDYCEIESNRVAQYAISIRLSYADRPDPFSSYRSGFELRITRRCTRIELHTHFDGDQLVRRFDFGYVDDDPTRASELPPNRVSQLARVDVTGHDGELRQAYPPLTFTYSTFAPDRRNLIPIGGDHLRGVSLADKTFELVDLFGHGLPDLLQLDGTGARYWRNLGRGRFDIVRELPAAPPLNLGDPDVRLLDADGDGRVDLTVSMGNMAGYFPSSFDGLWDASRFRRWSRAPSFRLSDPNVRLIDLDGDGVIDALRSGSRLECFFNDRTTGWSELRIGSDVDGLPELEFADPRVNWADLTGDGLQDMILVHDGSIEYWPNLGYGHFGARVRMENSPRLPYGWDPARLLFGDVDGDGVADLVYIERDRVTVWINQSGNRWSEPVVISGTPPAGGGSVLRLIDLCGSGVAGLLWNLSDDGSERPRMWFLDLTGGLKPYLLDRVENHLGAVTRVSYATSTEYFLADETAASTRWKTTLPFPVQVVASTESIDALSKTRLVSEFHYRHGYWDGVDREFRGFGMVEQRDTQQFDELPDAPLLYAAPVVTRQWFHVGPIGDDFDGWREVDYSDEYWLGDPTALAALDDRAPLLSRLSRRDRRDALRCLRGRMLRSELYALDGATRQDRPFDVSEAVFSLREESPPGDDLRRRVFASFARAHRTTAWERGDDPHTRLDITWDFDAYGQPGAQMLIGVPRGRDWRAAGASGAPYLATATLTTYAQRDDGARFIVDREARSTRYEIVNDGSVSALSLVAAMFSGAAQTNVLGQARRFYDGPPFVGLPLGQIGDFGASVRVEQLALTDALLRQALAYNGTLTVPPYLSPGAPSWTADYPDEFRTLMPSQAGYVIYGAGNDPIDQPGYWITTEQRRYDFQSGSGGRGLTLARRDALGRETTIGYDGFALLPAQVMLPTGINCSAQYDYRVQQPNQYVDANGNLTRFTFTPLGLLETTVRAGRPGASLGDTAAQPGTRYTYDLEAFMARGKPISVRTSQRAWHALDTTAPPDERDQTLDTIEFSDGFGRSLQTRVQAESVLFGDGTFGGGLMSSTPGTPPTTLQGATALPGAARVRVSSWQLYDNKGQVVRRFEPFFALGFDYAPPTSTQLGQQVTMYYDARGNLVRVVRPDGSEEINVPGVPLDLADPTKLRPTPWESYRYDANDNAGRTHPAASAAWRSHWNTPASRAQDALGRVIDSVVRNGVTASDELHTQSRYDLRGNVIEVRDPLGRVSAGFVYDLLDRPWRLESLDGGTRRNVLDAAGNLIEHRDDRDALTLAAFDVGKRPVRQWGRDAAGAAVTLRQRRVYGDGADSGLTAAAAQAANLLGRLYRHYDEAGLATASSYDFKGNLLEKARQTISDDVLAAPLDHPPPNWKPVAYTVDWQPPAGTTLDQLATQLLDGTLYVTTSHYDGLDRARAVTLPVAVDGQRHVIASHYDEAGQLDRIALDGTIYVAAIAYTASQRRAFVAYRNGVLTLLEHDALTRRLVRLRSGRFTQPDALTLQPTGEALQDIGFAYDLVGNLLALADRTPGSGVPGGVLGPDALDRAFDYDPIYRLLSADGRECAVPLAPAPWQDDPQCTDATLTRVYAERYAYDAVGNLVQLARTSSAGTFNRTMALAGNRLSSVTIGQQVSQYAYDAAGNVIAEDQARRYHWNDQCQLRVFRVQTDGSEPSIFAQYLYDAAGRRLKKLVRRQGGQWESTIYIDGLFEYHRLGRGSGVPMNNELHLLDSAARFAVVRIGPAFPGDGTPAVQVHLADHIGSSNVVVDDQGGFVNREEYRPWGETSMGSYARKRYRFTAKERDEESGLYYHGARYYACWLGRWTAIDPLALLPAEASTHSPYRYANDNPFAFVDPTGLDDEKPPPDPKEATTQQEFDDRLTATRKYEHEQQDRLNAARESEHLVLNGSAVNASGGVTHAGAYQAEGELKFVLDKRLRTLTGSSGSVAASASLRVGLAGDLGTRLDAGPTVVASTEDGGSGTAALQWRLGPAKSDDPGFGLTGAVGSEGIKLSNSDDHFIFNNTLIYTARVNDKTQVIPALVLNTAGAGTVGGSKVSNPLTVGALGGYNRKLTDNWSLMTELGIWSNFALGSSSGPQRQSWTVLEGINATYTKNNPDTGYQWSFTVEASQETPYGGSTIWAVVGYGASRSQFETIHGPAGYDRSPQ